MPCGNSTQVFAFTTLSPTSQLSLASSMTTSALLDFATASPAFMIFLRTHCEEIVLGALKTQYGYIPEKSTWSCTGLLPLYNNLPPHIPDIQMDDSTPRSVHRTSMARRHKRGSQDTTELLQELPTLQWLIDEEQLTENGRKLLEMLPRSDHSQSLYYAGVRGLVRYCQKYSALCSSVVTKKEINEQMQRWLQERYTPWGINEMWFVVDALGSRIEELIPSLRNDQARREQLLGTLLCKMDVLRLFSYDFASSAAINEETALRLLLEDGIVEIPPTAEGTPITELQWKVRDGSHSHWFTTPAQEALSGKPITSSSRRQSRSHSSCYSISWSSESSPNNYVIGHGSNYYIAPQGGNFDQASLDLNMPRNWRDLESMKLMMMAGVAARAHRATARAKAFGIRGGVWADRGLVDWGMIGV